jgi:predicted N-acetyltransferase YhbS
MAVIRPLAENDLPEVQRIIRLAFGTQFGVPDLESFWTDRDYAFGRFGAEHTAAFAAEQDGVLVGSNFATSWGTVGFFGPVSVRPDLENSGIGQRLVAAACQHLAASGVRHAGLFTFSQSAKHVWLYQKFGFYPRFLTAIMAAPARPSGLPLQQVHYSALAADQRHEAEGACQDLTDALYGGLDLSGEIRTVAARRLGDTVLLGDGEGGLAGFAICHWGPASEAGADACFIKFAAARTGAGADTRFDVLLDACAALAVEAGMATLLAGVNTARHEAYRHMLARGFRTQIQGVAMHRPNNEGYSRPGLYVLDDWR